jgi:hypothetical protein
MCCSSTGLEGKNYFWQFVRKYAIFEAIQPCGAGGGWFCVFCDFLLKTSRKIIFECHEFFR